MSAPHGDQIVAGYLAQLELALAAQPSSRGAEILAEIRDHIVQARAQLKDETDADVYNLLDRVGDPAELAAGAGTDPATGTVAPRTNPFGSVWLDIAAVILTPFLWPVGVILLWISPNWTLRERLIGTLVPPGGYIGVAYLFAFVGQIGLNPQGGCSAGADSNGGSYTSCSGLMAMPGVFLVAYLIVMSIVLITWWLLPILTAIYLGVRVRRRMRSTSDAGAVQPVAVGHSR